MRLRIVTQVTGSYVLGLFIHVAGMLGLTNSTLRNLSLSSPVYSRLSRSQ